MKCLVTGAAGFIGSHLAERLLDEGHAVRAVDRLSPYYNVDLKRENLASVVDTGPLDFFDVDLATCEVQPLLEDVDVVYHLAAQAGVRASWGEEFEVYLRDNVLATQRLLEAARATAVERIVLASSSSIYGDADAYPVSEEDPPRPRSPYGATKAAMESLGRLYHVEFEVPIVSLRYFTVFGPRQRPDMAFNRFVSAALSGEPIKVYGDGHQRRDFTYVDDVVAATIAASASNAGQTYNVAGGCRATINEVACLLEDMLGHEITVEHGPAALGDVRETGGSTAKARRDLGYEPVVSLSDGLGRQVEWQQALAARHA